ncbi:MULTISPECIES: MIP/aquaporin family protein [Streptomyces]|uniref:MIP/aquaporin family protein n=1 Tax=Streptomyces flaveolus TaxID=67297 RepID=A0ABV3A1B0_9ACTN|nr:MULTISPECIES: MIP/aquaporin family protein [Streptomyces]KMS86925.1 MIP family channel protein [Streptomyces regensis]KOG70428.1 MIP family channel protein [Streptomyces antibioticus]KOV97913.1 MIP family channel protein [Streptomyces sp. NRRL WC-3723]MBG7701498.1 aquaporin family protein [Streptomyces sp. MC1]
MAVEIPPLIKPSRLRSRGGLLGECVAEFLGTFVLISFGCGVVAMAVAALPGSGRAATATTIFLAAGDWLLITWGWALAVVFGVYVAGGVSGAHINPAVTLAMAVRRGFPWVKVLPYWFAQVVGALTGAALVYLVYHNAIDAYDSTVTGPKVNGHTNATFSIFATFPAPYFHGGIWGPLIDQIVGTAFLLMLIAAVLDLRNQAVKANLAPLIVGFVVAAIGMSYGANAGYAINPARDFGPRLLTYAAGWDSLAFPGSVSGSFSAYWWIPIVGPLIGGLIGILIYDLFIGDVLLLRSELAQLPEPGRSTPVQTTDEE